MSKDALRVLRATGSDLELAIVKATNHDIAAPKPKHVQTIKEAAADKQQLMAEIFDLLTERYQSKSWMVVYKALMITQEIMREKDARALKFVALSPQILNMASFRDRCTLDGLTHATHIQKYAEYLEEKAITYKEASFDFVKESLDKAGRLTAKENPVALIRLLTLLQRQLSKLLECKYTSDEINNSVILAVYRMLLKDLLRLYHSLNEGVINILEYYFKMPKEVAKDALIVYKLFVKQTDLVIDFLNAGKELQAALSHEIPVLKSPPTSLVDSLQAYVDGRLSTSTATTDLPPVERLTLTQNKQTNDRAFRDSIVAAPAQVPFDDFAAFGQERAAKPVTPATSTPTQDLLSFDEPEQKKTSAFNQNFASPFAQGFGTPQDFNQQAFASFPQQQPQYTPFAQSFAPQPFAQAFAPQPASTNPFATAASPYPQPGTLQQKTNPFA